MLVGISVFCTKIFKQFVLKKKNNKKKVNFADLFTQHVWLDSASINGKNIKK